MRVLKQRAISNLLHEIKQFEKIRTSFLLQSELKNRIITRIYKNLAKVRKVLSHLTLPSFKLDI